MFATIQRWLMIGGLVLALAGVITVQFYQLRAKDAELEQITVTLEIQTQTIEQQQVLLEQERARHQALNQSVTANANRRTTRVDNTVTELTEQLVESSQP